MADISMSRHAAGSRRSGRGTVQAMADWLCLAAAPTFALMALLAAAAGQRADMLCAGDGSPISGMVPMYLLMIVFHLPPWLRLISNRRGDARAGSIGPGT